MLNNSLHTCVSQLTAEDAFKLEDRVEASMIQLQADLHEAKSRNIYLNDLVEEQKRQAVTTKLFVINGNEACHFCYKNSYHYILKVS